MGKFKEMAIELEEARLLTSKHGKCEDCNAMVDTIIQLNQDLKVAIEFGEAAEEHIDQMHYIMSSLLKDIISHNVATIEELPEKYGLAMVKIPKTEVMN